MQTDHDLVLEQLRAAFPVTEIESDDAFTAWGMTYADGEEYARRLSGKHWDMLDGAYLDLRSDALGFLGTMQLVAVLPAYLRQLLTGGPFSQVPDMLLLTLTKPGPKIGSKLGKKRFDAMIDALTDPQRAAVASVLDRFIKDHPGTSHASAAQLALDMYWHEFIIAGKG
jgi:hypothetical protein